MSHCGAQLSELLRLSFHCAPSERCLTCHAAGGMSVDELSAPRGPWHCVDEHCAN